MPSSTSLDYVRKFSTVVADTGDIEAIKQYKPQDATTNPTLILAASKLPFYGDIIASTIKEEISRSASLLTEELIDDICRKMMVNFGCAILENIDGRVSTEVDPRYSFDAKKSVLEAKKIIALYEARGIPKDRVLIKLATTWEGCQAAIVLQKEYGIQCNMTLLFSLVQAVAAADAGAFLISPFVGRILDWYKKNDATRSLDGIADPGVQSVTEIYNYYRSNGIKTKIMGASFRNIEEIKNLVGCDLLTISPQLLHQLSLEESIETKPALCQATSIPKMEIDEAKFRWLLNQNQVATEKLSEGIRNFAIDFEKMRAFVKVQAEKMRQ